jgi:hypothetical protein
MVQLFSSKNYFHLSVKGLWAQECLGDIIICSTILQKKIEAKFTDHPSKLTVFVNFVNLPSKLISDWFIWFDFELGVLSTQFSVQPVYKIKETKGK